MYFQICRVDHEYIGLITFARQLGQDAGECTLATPAHPPVVQRFWPAVVGRRMPQK